MPAGEFLCMSDIPLDALTTHLLKADVLGWKREVDESAEAVEQNWKTFAFLISFRILSQCSRWDLFEGKMASTGKFSEAETGEVFACKILFCLTFFFFFNLQRNRLTD